VDSAVVAVWFALVLGAVPEVWAETQGIGDEAAACDVDALATALRVDRPGLVVRAMHPDVAGPAPPAGALRVRLTRRDGTTLVEIEGAGKTIVRTLPAADGCERNIATAALIVDGALDDLAVSRAAPRVDSLAPPVPLRKQIHFSGLAGAGVERGVFRVVPAFDVEGAVRYRSLALTLDVDVGLGSSTDFSVTPPEAGNGTFSAATVAVDLGVGFSPRLGPGRLAASVAFGFELAVASVRSTSVFQQQGQTSEEPFGALRLGYELDLPWGLFVEVRGEARASPRAAFQVVGASFVDEGGGSIVMTPIWTFGAFGFVGYHFF
jgi:hypothetical protein